VAVARALIRQPRLLLLDEPLSALDRNVRHGIREELLRIHAELGTTFVLVTHDQDEALSMSQEVALMNEGRIEQLADPETLYRNPATLFAARFVGAGTFLLARAIGRHGRHVEFELQGRRFHALDAGVEIGSTAEVLLRPEDLSLNRDRAVQVPGRVATCSFLGSYYELTVDSDLGRFRVRETHALAPGSPVEVGWPETAGIAYPRASDVGAEM
jgi:ABC-type Fe3+/spermidine/putrescine transport system ATPase subunit